MGVALPYAIALPARGEGFCLDHEMCESDSASRRGRGAPKSPAARLTFKSIDPWLLNPAWAAPAAGGARRGRRAYWLKEAW
jgi:hypothetical protein